MAVSIAMHSPAPFEMIGSLLVRMSETDRAELEALASLHGLDGGGVIGSALSASSHSFCYTVDGEPAAIGGLREDGYVWMVVSEPILDGMRKTFLRYSRDELRALQRLAGQNLRVIVDRRWGKSLKWLRWLGFETVGEASIAGRDGVILELAA